MSKSKNQMAVCLAPILAAIALGVGCTTPTSTSLEPAIESFYVAEQTHDWKTMWAFAAPTFKKHGTYKEFADQWQRDTVALRIVSWKVIRIEDMKVEKLVTG